MAFIRQPLCGLFLLVLATNIYAFGFSKSSSSKTTCPDAFFDCHNGRCVAPFFVCDDDNDCGNHEDELNCFGDIDSGTNTSSTNTQPLFECPEDHFHCNDQFFSCLPQRWVCDGIKECSNGADEVNCTTKMIDCADDFRCKSGDECVPKVWLCDSIHDCADSSDEMDCKHIQSVEVNCDKEHGKYKCASGECIDYSKRCDNKKDCIFGDDEGIQCHLKSCNDKRCSHLCVEEPSTNSTRCICPAGYQLKNDTTCVDFDECSDNKLTNMCSQICVNLEGSHRCDCESGYTLVNETRCVVTDGPAVLFYSFDDQIRSFELKKNRVSESFIGKRGETISELDVDIARRKLYYVGIRVDSHGSLYEAEFDGDFKLSQPKVLLNHHKLSGSEGIAVDYITGNVYLSNSERNSIMVCKSEPILCLNLIEHRKSPRAVIVLPLVGKLYWTEWGSFESNGIYESNMDGSNITLLIGGLSWPNGLAYDEVRNRLYWTDGKTGKIEYYDFDIKLRHHVFEDSLRQPYMIHVFEDNLYWSDWSRNELVVQEKITGHQLAPIIFNSFNRLLGLTIYHPSLQKHGFNPCGVNLCSHMCLIKTNVEYTCACPDHMKLVGKYQCQIDQDQPYILASTGRRLYKFFTSEISNSHSEEILLPARVFIGELTYDFSNQCLYIFDAHSVSIGRIEYIKSRPRYERIVSEDIQMIVSLRFEPNSRSLYWIDYITDRVEVFSIDKKHRLTLFDKISKPISLALDPSNRIMYIGARSHPARIYSSALDGTSLQKIMETRNNGIPIAIVKQGRTLIWADPTLSKIERITTVGSTVVGKPKKLNTLSVGSIHTMDSHNQTIFWTNADSPKLFYSNQLSPYLSSPIVHVYSRNLPFTETFNTEDVRLISVQKNAQTLTDCVSGRNKCPHLCLVGQRGQSCRCANGFLSKDNGQTCIEDKSTRLIHFAHPNETQTFQWVLSNIEDLFRKSFNDTEDDDYYISKGDASSSQQEQLITVDGDAQVTVVKIDKTDSDKHTVIEVDDVRIRPRHSPWKIFIYAIMIITACVIALFCRIPNLRRTIANIRLPGNLLNRNVSSARFFRNPNYNVGCVADEDVIFEDEHTSDSSKVRDANSNLLL